MTTTGAVTVNEDRDRYFRERVAVAMKAISSAGLLLGEIPEDISQLATWWLVEKPLQELALAIEALRPFKRQP